MASSILLAWTYPTPNRRALQCSRCGKMKDLYYASITSIGTKCLILLSAPVFAYVFFSWLEEALVRSEIHASETIFDHLLNSYLWMPTKEKFYEYVRNATHGKKCYVNQGSRKMILTVPARFSIVLIVSEFAERWF